MRFHGKRKRIRKEPVIRSSFGQGFICHYIPGESSTDRHNRRYDSAIKHYHSVAAWCESRGIQFQVFGENGRDYWKWDFRKGVERFAQWRPWCAKFTCKRNVRELEYHSIKTHDVEQLLKALEWWLQ